MRLRFTIRDLLWLTLIVGLIAGWCLDHLATAQRCCVVSGVTTITFSGKWSKLRAGLAN